MRAPLRGAWAHLGHDERAVSRSQRHSRDTRDFRARLLQPGVQRLYRATPAGGKQWSPNRPRLLDAIETLGDRLEDQRDRSSSALLYAYIGRLLEERDTIERGLDILAEDTPDDPLLPLLRTIWLSEDEPEK